MSDWPEIITPFYRSLINWSDPTDPLKKMVLYSPSEKIIKAEHLSDPIGDRTHQVVSGLIHRYPKTALILTTSNCSQHCRFCFRRSLKLTSPDWPKIYTYLKSHPQINEIIFSGGDPLTLSPASWSPIIKNLKSISHLLTFRIHSRLPIVDPLSIKASFFSLWPKNINLSLVVHVNHPQEISPEALKLLSQFKKHGWLLLSQTVLLKAVNDKKITLINLFSTLWQHGIKPYYLHHLDLVPGTAHFRLSLYQGKKLFQSLRGQIAGPALPTYVLDLPGGFGKVPVSWLKKIGPKKYKIKNFQGKFIIYNDPV